MMRLLHKQPNVQPTNNSAQVPTPANTAGGFQVLRFNDTSTKLNAQVQNVCRENTAQVPTERPSTVEFHVDQTSFIHSPPGQDTAQTLVNDYCAQEHQVLKLLCTNDAQVTMIPVDLPDPEQHWKRRSQGLSHAPYQQPHASTPQIASKPSTRPPWLSAPHIYKRRVYF